MAQTRRRRPAKPSGCAVRAFVLFGLGCSLGSQPSSAQYAIQPLIDPAVLPDYNRNRNVSVAEAPHADYDTLGITLGGFQVFPSLTATTLANSNVFFDDFDKHGDVAGLIQPSVLATSDWANGLLQVYATDQVRQDLHYTRFDKNTWDAHVNGRVDLTDAFSMSALVQAGRFTENPYSSVVDGNFAVFSLFDQITTSLKGVWTRGHLRVTAQYDHFSVQYVPFDREAGADIDQVYRDNHNDRGMAQAEYSLSPSLALYSQVSFDRSRYRYAEFGALNRNSTGAAFVSGFSLDWSGVARGALGLGYSRRDYASGAFGNPSGVSMQAKLEVFPSAATTLAGSAYRLLRDANSGPSAAYYDARAEFDVDHALRQNVIVSARLYYGGQDFVEDPRRRTFYQASIGGKVKFDRRFKANIDLGYSKSTTNSASAGAPFGQIIGSIALQYRI